MELSNVTANSTFYYDRLADVQSKFPEVRYLWRINFIVTIAVASVILLVGTIGNVITYAVLSQKAFARNHMSLMLRFLSVMDLVILWTVLLRYYVRAISSFDLRTISFTVCRIHHIYALTCNSVNNWMLIMITVMRYVAIRFPFFSRRVCTPAAAYFGLFVILVGCIGGFSIFFTLFVSNMNMEKKFSDRLPDQCISHFESKLHEVAFKVIQVTIEVAVPAILLIIFNLLMILAHRNVQERRAYLTNSYSYFNRRTSADLLKTLGERETKTSLSDIEEEDEADFTSGLRNGTVVDSDQRKKMTQSPRIFPRFINNNCHLVNAQTDNDDKSCSRLDLTDHPNDTRLQSSAVTGPYLEQTLASLPNKEPFTSKSSDLHRRTEIELAVRSPSRKKIWSTVPPSKSTCMSFRGSQRGGHTYLMETTNELVYIITDENSVGTSPLISETSEFSITVKYPRYVSQSDPEKSDDVIESQNSVFPNCFVDDSINTLAEDKIISASDNNKTTETFPISPNYFVQYTTSAHVVLDANTRIQDESVRGDPGMEEEGRHSSHLTSCKPIDLDTLSGINISQTHGDPASCRCHVSASLVNKDTSVEGIETTKNKLSSSDTSRVTEKKTGSISQRRNRRGYKEFAFTFNRKYKSAKEKSKHIQGDIDSLLPELAGLDISQNAKTTPKSGEQTVDGSGLLQTKKCGILKNSGRQQTKKEAKINFDGNLSSTSVVSSKLKLSFLSHDSISSLSMYEEEYRARRNSIPRTMPLSTFRPPRKSIVVDVRQMLKPEDPKSQTNTQSLTGLIVLTSILFVVLNVPYCVWYLTSSFLFTKDEIGRAKNHLVNTFVILLKYTNIAANFLIYSAFGTRFRLELRKLFQKCCRRAKRKNRL
ncbi:uncharacterized protein LOC101856786 [Aplysia californica]|uniref:Uncharacterized protein LOC101856786 n=1 Tax=Aplysia californica TaxID=6500 RepID=A0ABM0ZV24_APLCA|nr:uncharacterized protein LOC101856786 [Aplysia californica]